MRERVAGTELQYEDRGGGPPILFLHAFPLGLFMWDEQVAAFEGNHRLVRFDYRGFGGSPAGDEPLTMDRIADDAAALLDHLDIRQAIVVGCSMGGYAAFAMARRHASRLRGLVLQNTRAGADTAEARKNRGALADRVLREGAGAAVDAFLPRLVGPTTARDFPDRVAQLREAALRNPPRGIANALLGLGARADSSSTLRDISVPTLVVGGEEDVLTPVAEAAAIHAGIPGSRFAVIPRAGHLANLENAPAYNGVLTRFLGGIDG